MQPQPNENAIPNYVVYYDFNYPTWWIERPFALNIAIFLEKNNFQVVNAPQLADWMNRAIRTNTAHNCTVVFSQDVVPDTVFQSPNPSCLVRQFLDSGGKIVWIGDNPFYYCGINQLGTPNDPSEIVQLALTNNLARNDAGELAIQFGLDGAYSVLGVIPVFMPAPSDRVKITREGRKLGLRYSWYGNRPIIKKGETVHKPLEILGHSKPIPLIPSNKISPQPEEGTKNKVSSALSSLTTLLGLIPAIGTAVAAFVAYLAKGATSVFGVFIGASMVSAVLYAAYWLLRQKEAYANAWLKSYNDRYRQTGFLRLWDFKPMELTDQMLYDLLAVATNK